MLCNHCRRTPVFRSVHDPLRGGVGLCQLCETRAFVHQQDGDRPRQRLEADVDAAPRDLSLYRRMLHGGEAPGIRERALGAVHRGAIDRSVRRRPSRQLS